jgi:uncharacterized protein YdaU (DUF1376 family)
LAQEDSPSFQYYPRDYLSDAKVRAMSYTERGMYWELVSLLWGEVRLPADPVLLSRILGVPPTVLKRHWPALAPCFRVVGESIEHGRLEIERRKQLDNKAIRTAAGKLGGEAKARRRAEDLALLEKPASKIVAEASLSSSSSSSKEDVAHTPVARTPRLHQGSRPNRMNPGGVVPLIDTQFGEFVSRVSPKYPDRSAAYAAVLAWMGAEDDAATAAGRPIGGDPFKWWRERFDVWSRDDRPAAPKFCRRRHSPPCANDADCTRRYMDEQQGAPAVAS